MSLEAEKPCSHTSEKDSHEAYIYIIYIYHPSLRIRSPSKAEAGLSQSDSLIVPLHQQFEYLVCECPDD